MIQVFIRVFQRHADDKIVQDQETLHRSFFLKEQYRV